MIDRRTDPPGAGGEGQAPPASDRPRPRDLPDQQADTADETPDRWDPEEPPRYRADEELPDTDVAGTGPRGTPEPEPVNPEQPAPEEPTD